MAYEEDYLAHFGVKGMKWGVRKASYYDKKRNKYIAKIGTSKTRLGKNYHNYKALASGVKARRFKSVSEDGSLINKYSNLAGMNATINHQRETSEYYKRKASYSKTSMGKKINEINAYNQNQYANANQRVKDTKGIVNKGKAYIDSSFNTPLKTISGKDTTIGKEQTKRILMYIGYEAIKAYLSSSNEYDH